MSTSTTHPDKKLTAVIVVPASNTTMEAEIRGYFPEIGEVIRIGVPREPKPMLIGELPEYRAKTMELIAPMKERRPDVVLYGCTTAGFLSGLDKDNELADALAEATGAPAVTAAASMVNALRHSSVDRPAIVTPYLDASNDELVRFLQSIGIDVAGLDSFRIENIAGYDQVPLAELKEMAIDAVKKYDADGLFVACTQLRTLGALDDLQTTLKLPTWGAIQATAWAGRNALGLPAQP